MTKEFNGFHTENELGPVDDEAICFQAFEEFGKVSEMLLGVRTCN